MIKFHKYSEDKANLYFFQMVPREIQLLEATEAYREPSIPAKHPFYPDIVPKRLIYLQFILGWGGSRE